ncbi:TonB-dependent receptor [Niabella drilacis]|uniref:Carboxypeptidase regulatory-like domain-containing protein n=1 Tax=Niabella drilacis (strain DSM 25811 / CCM 8410 / CCUG 62505 / LMG 26954 / E90) TaxID=1285928 RepID=A0A1G6Q9E6_NIADE|nr:TonB-dependent receptor [Niabella drilacis]SDC88943.1 Carboxypeptidase regulatory-like domain-containing protein [Niabella drilacis]
MRPIIFAIFLLLTGTISYSQTGKLTGLVTDSASNTPLESATVTIFRKDSGMVTYKLTDKNGNYLLENLPTTDSLLLDISYVGYRAHRQTLRITHSKTDTVNAALAIGFDEKDNVTVNAVIPVKMEGDTLVINPAAFKMKPDAVAEELLTQVPGVVVWSDGSITVNGRSVKNLLVDGKQFMGSSDPKIATQNLPKTAIDKIQLYQEYDRSKIGQQKTAQDSVLTMNIKLKEESKKGYFGKITGGYGTDHRYEANISYQIYDKRRSLGIGGGINNINKNIENLQELFQNNTYRTYNPNLDYVGQFGSNGLNRNHSIGAVYTQDFNKVLNSRQNNRITLNYNKSGTDAYITNQNLQNRTTADNPQFIKDESVQNDWRSKHVFGADYSKTSSYSDNLHINGNVEFNQNRGNTKRFTEVSDTSGQLQSTNDINTISRGRSDAERLSFSYSKSDWQEPLKNINISLNGGNNNSISERDVVSRFNSFTDAGNDTTYNRHYKNDNNGINLSGDINYNGFKRLLLGRYNFFGIDLGLSQRFSYNKQTNRAYVSDFDSIAGQLVINNRLTNSNTRELLEYAPQLYINKSFFKWSERMNRSISFSTQLIDDLKSERNHSSIAERNLNRSFQFFRYQGDIRYSYSQSNKSRLYGGLSYEKNFDYPSIDQLYTITDDINAYSIRYGNPDLKNRTNHTLSINANFNTENQKSLYSINGGLYGNYRKTIDPISDSVINDKESGKRFYYSINADKSSNANLNYNFNIARKLGKSSLQLRYNGYQNYSVLPNYIDGLYTNSRNNSISNNLNLQFSLRALLVLNIGESFQTNRSKQTAAGLSSFKNTGNTTKFGATLNLPKSITLSSTFNITNNTGLNKTMHLWNAFATYRFMKQQAEFKFSAMDILKQYQNISNDVNFDGTTTRITNGLQQYFLLTFSYYPRKFGKKELKQKATEHVW